MQLYPKVTKITKTQRGNYIETNKRSTLDATIPVSDRTNLIIGGATSKREVFPQRNLHYVKWQVAHDLDICPSYVGKADCDVDHCGFLHLDDRTQWKDTGSKDIKEFLRYNEYHANRNREMVQKQIDAYGEERCWRQYERSVIIGRGIYDPVEWQEHEELKKQLKRSKNKVRKRKADNSGVLHN